MKEVLLMAKVCKECGKEYNNKGRWLSCPDCDELLCPNCVQNLAKEKQAKEKRQRQQLENTKSLEDYKQLSCPRCGTEMVPF